MAYNLFENFRPEQAANVWYREYYNTRPYLYEAYLPGQRTETLDVEWLQGRENLPVTLEPSALDTKMINRPRPSFSSQKITIPFFRESAILNERDAQMAFRYIRHPDLPGGSDFARRLFNDGANLLESVRVNKELMFIGMITDARFEINGKAGTSNENMNAIVQYDPTNTWRTNNKIDITATDPLGTGTDLADPDFNILEYLMTFTNDLELQGKSVTTAIIGLGTLNDLMKNNHIKGLINNTVQIPLQYVTYNRQQVLTALEGYTGIRFIVHNKAYGLKDSLDFAGPVIGENGGRPDGEFYFPQRGTICLLPPGNLGNMYHGVTPEEMYGAGGFAELIEAGAMGATQNISIVDSGIALCTMKKLAPAQLTTWVSGLFAPSFPMRDECYVMTYNSFETP